MVVRFTRTQKPGTREEETEGSRIARQNDGNGKKISKKKLFVDTDDFDRGVSTSTTYH